MTSATTELRLSAWSPNIEFKRLVFAAKTIIFMKTETQQFVGRERRERVLNLTHPAMLE